MGDYPKYLARFYKPEHGLAALKNKKFRITSPLKFNDPFDPLMFPHFDFDGPTLVQYFKDKHLGYYKQQRRHIEEAANSLADDHARAITNVIMPAVNSMRILCFYDGTRKPEQNLLMWAHYGDAHRGMMIKFVPGVGVEGLEKVRYRRKFPRVTVEDFVAYHMGNPTPFMEKVANNVAYTKSIDWKTEREWRIIYQKSQDPYEPEIPERAIHSVYLGVRADKRVQCDVRVELRRNFPNAKLFQTHIMNGSFALRFEEIS